MKKFFFFISLTILSFTMKSQEVSLMESKRAATNFFTKTTGKAFTINDIASVKSYVLKSDTVFRAVNFKNNAGFVLISNSKAALPVLGYVVGQNFDTTSAPVNFKNLLKDYGLQILDIRKRNLSSGKKIARQWKVLSHAPLAKGSMSTTGPLLTTIWSQGCYYNDSCPADPAGPCGHVVTGCVATAMSQVINYFNFPPKGSGKHSYQSAYGLLSANFGHTNYNWSLMADTLNSSTPAAKVAAVAQLISQCGIAVDMGYSAGGSGAYSQDAMNAFIHYFNFNPDMDMRYRDNYADSVWEQMLIYNLDSVGPLYYDGTGTGGHAFVCDGYQFDNNLNAYLFHYNWGWNGAYNGYFTATNLNPGGMNFSMYNSAVFNMKPAYPVSCTGTTDTLTSPEGNLSDGSSYLNYQNNTNCSWLIQTGALAVNLQFYTFDLKAGDTVKVYDGSSAAAPLIVALTGDSLPAPVFSSGGDVFISFTSDSAVTGEGWSASYAAEFCLGTTTLTSPNGQFSDGSGSYNYHNNSNCSWLISPASQQPVHLLFTHFKTEQGYDFVKIYDGTGTGSPLLGDFSGDTIPPMLTAASGNMLVVFTSDGGVVDEGWDAIYYTTCDTLAPPQTAGGNEFCSGDSLMLYSPGVYDTVQWFFQGTVLSQDTLLWAKQGGTYFYRAFRAGCGWDSSATLLIKENPLPAPFLGADTLLCYISDISDTLISKPNNFASWLWSTGDTTPFLVLDSAFCLAFMNSTANIWVLVGDSLGCQNSDSINIYVQVCEGIGENTAPEYLIYPNPYEDVIYWKTDDLNTKKTIILFDESGRIIYRKTVYSSQGTIKTDKGSAGLYLLKIKTDSYEIQRLVVKKKKR